VIQMVDCPPQQGIQLKDTLQIRPATPIGRNLQKPLESVFIDTGENGTFSRAEFEAISTPGQMEFVTPEEIAETVLFEIRGGNTGHDIINALDNATLNPTYRAGFMFENALRHLKALERKHDTKSVAFEILGPPRLSKLLYEAYLLELAYKKVDAVLQATPKAMTSKLEGLISKDAELRARMISIGIPILMPDGKTLLRGNEIKIPPYRGENELKVTDASLNAWAHDGWVDLRKENMELWKSRLAIIREEVTRIPEQESSSRYFRTSMYWENFEEIDPGKVVGWIFSEEEKGKRMKA